MKWFLVGAFTPLVIYSLAWFAAKGWRAGYGKQNVDVYIHGDSKL